jgi:hypothetical protein
MCCFELVDSHHWSGSRPTVETWRLVVAKWEPVQPVGCVLRINEKLEGGTWPRQTTCRMEGHLRVLAPNR